MKVCMAGVVVAVSRNRNGGQGRNYKERREEHFECRKRSMNECGEFSSRRRSACGRAEPRKKIKPWAAGEEKVEDGGEERQ